MKKPRGFTLIEVMITVVIIGILAAIAYPSYTGYMRNSRRSEAYVALTQLANAQEKFYLNCNSYTASITGAVAGCVGLGFASATSSPQGYYDLAAVACAGGTLTTCYTLTATAIGIQAADTACPILSLASAGAKTPTTCWK